MVAGPAKSTRVSAASAARTVSAARSSQTQDVLIAEAEQKLDIPVNPSTQLAGRSNALLSWPATNHNSARAYYSRGAACYLLRFGFFKWLRINGTG